MFTNRQGDKYSIPIVMQVDWIIEHSSDRTDITLHLIAMIIKALAYGIILGLIFIGIFLLGYVLTLKVW